MESIFNSQDIDILTAIYFSQGFFRQGISLNNISQTCDMYNRTGYYFDDLNKTLKKLISHDIIFIRNNRAIITKKFRKQKNKNHKKTNNYFDLFDQIKTLLKNKNA